MAHVQGTGWLKELSRPLSRPGRSALAARIVAWGRLCGDEQVREAYAEKRPPFARQTARGGRVEVVSAREGGAALMPTAEIVIVDELRVFHQDMLGELVDRQAEAVPGTRGPRPV